MNLAAELGQRYGIAVNYEDAPLDPISDLGSEFHPSNGITYLMPKWRPITFSVPADIPTNEDQLPTGQAVQSPPDLIRALSMLKEMVSHYNESGNPGRFTVAAEGKYLHIEQDTRMIGGQRQPFTPISRMVARWSSRSESCQQLLSDLFTAIGTQYGVKLAEGSVPMGPLLTHPCSADGEAPTVGQVLERVIVGLETDASTGKVSTEVGYAWQLVYEPNWNKYFLNFEAVRHQSPVVTQTIQPNTPASKTGSVPGSGRLGSGDAVKPHP